MEKVRLKIVEHVKNYYRELYGGKIAPAVKVCSGSVLAERLGYSRDLIEWLTCRGFPWSHVYPCGNPAGKGLFKPGDIVLNLGCGVGLDAYAFMFEVGKRPSHDHASLVVNVDVVPEVLKVAVGWAERLCGIPENFILSWICADALKLPLKEKSFDFVILNGVFNIFPEKEILLKEVRRVLRPGGTVIVADIFVSASLPDYVLKEPDAWAWCIAGALTEEELLKLLDLSAFTPCVWLEKEELIKAPSSSSCHRDGEWELRFYRGVFASRVAC